MTASTTDMTPRRAAVVAGAALSVMFVAAVVATDGTINSLIVEGDAITSGQRAAISRGVGRLPLEVEAARTLPRTRKGDVDRRALQARQHGGSAAA